MLHPRHLHKDTSIRLEELQARLQQMRRAEHLPRAREGRRARSALRTASFHCVDTGLGGREAGAVRDKKAQTSERGHRQLPEG